MDNLNSTTPTRKCTKCAVVYPANREYFHRNGKAKDGCYHICKVCSRVIALEKYHADPGNKDRQRERKRELYADPEYRRKALEYKKKDYQKHRITRLERCSEYYAKNKQQRDDYRKGWVKANPDKKRTYTNNRKSGLLNAEGTHSDSDVKMIVKRQKNKCYYCKIKLVDGYHVDHIIPLVRGGRNDIDNLVVACQKCNLRKGTKMPHEWIKGGRLL